MLNHGIVPASGGDYEISNSLRFNDDDSAYLSRTPSSAGNRKTWTWSGWVKRGNFNSYQTLFSASAASNTNYCTVAFNGDNQDYLDFQVADGDGTVKGRKRTSAKLRDPSAWYHIVAILDTTQATDSNRMKLYLNGSLVTDLSSDINNLVQNQDYFVNNTIDHRIGMNPWGSWKNDGYLAEVNFVDGQALTPADFGETGDYGEWKPTKYTGTYGTNGFYLDFSDSGSLGTDASSNSNNWTPNNLSATDQMLDSPTNNLATLNLLDKAGSNGSLAEGNLADIGGGNPANAYATTVLPSSGKWYAEFRISSHNYCQFAVANQDTFKNTYASGQVYGSGTVSWDTGAGVYYKNSTSSTADTVSVTANDIIQIAYDADTRDVWFGLNNTWTESGNPASGTNEIATVSGDGVLTIVVRAESATINANFGQDSSFASTLTAQGNQDSNGIGDFYYTPPTDFLALCTQNLPEPTVIPSEHFNTVLWSGNSTDGRDITGVGFDPDFVWIKSRNLTTSHLLNDTVRGANKSLFSETTNAETPNNGGGYLDAFVTDGFSVTSGSSGDDAVNDNGDTYAAWNWKANGSGVSNTDGSITSTVSANQDAGFSIVSYTGNGTSGATVGHGLSSKPEMILVKRRDAVGGWRAFHDANAANYYMVLDTTAARASSSSIFNNTEPTNSVFTVGSGGSVNSSGGTYIAYCFHSVDGYSKVGSYTGNGNADGTFVYTGFRPAYVLIKEADNSNDWHLIDNKREAELGNPVQAWLRPNTTNIEASSDNDIDLLSNGFKARTSSNRTNRAATLIYIAFAETPFSKSNAR